MTDIVRDPYGNPLRQDAEITRLTARVKEMEGALKPFADESLWSGPYHEFVTVKRSDCDRARARAALTQEKRDE